MHKNTPAENSQSRHPWVSAARNGIAGLMVCAVPIFACIYFGSGSFVSAYGAWAGDRKVTGVSDSPFAFDGPAVTAAHLRASKEDVEQLARAKDIPNNLDDALLLTEWDFTANRGRTKARTPNHLPPSFFLEFLLFDRNIPGFFRHFDGLMRRLLAELKHRHKHHQHASHHK